MVDNGNRNPQTTPQPQTPDDYDPQEHQVADVLLFWQGIQTRHLVRTILAAEGGLVDLNAGLAGDVRRFNLLLAPAIEELDKDASHLLRRSF